MKALRAALCFFVSRRTGDVSAQALLKLQTEVELPELDLPPGPRVRAEGGPCARPLRGVLGGKTPAQGGVRAL
ncbi:MAG: hypothetical protein ACREA0_01660, partial [bacterium]